VITVPAYFDDARRRATMDAGQIAGLTVLRVLNEPTAAALAFGHGAHRGETMLVYDLGGGTFDVTAVRVDGGGCEVLATDGDRNLGGFDFDNALMAHVDEAVRAGGGPSLLDGDLLEAALRDRCEHAKRALSTLPDTAVRITVGGREFAVPISRPRFEELTGGLLRRTEEIVRDVVDAAGAAPAAVLLVGGSTRMPMVGAMVERVTGARTDRSVHPDEAVALGAAVQAYELSRPVRGPRRAVVQDVTAHGVGLLARSTDTGGQLNSVVIPRNTPIPCEGRRRYRTLAENQREILLEVTEGEDEDPRYCSIVGSGWVSIPPRAEATLLDVVLTYDEDGMIAVDVVDVDSGEPLGDFVLDRQSNLDARQVERMRAALRAVTDRPA
jgi:molecular chaperone DnaK